MTHKEWLEKLRSQRFEDEVVDSVSLTQPDMSMTPQDIISRCVRHLPVGISYRETWSLPDAETLSGVPADAVDDSFFDYNEFDDSLEAMQYVKDAANKKRVKRKQKSKEPPAKEVTKEEPKEPPAKEVTKEEPKE